MDWRRWTRRSDIRSGGSDPGTDAEGAPPEPSANLSQLRPAIVDLLLRRAYEHRAEPFRLSSGAWSHDYIDCRRAMAGGRDLRLVAEAISAVAASNGVEFDAVGGLTLGSDPIAHAVALISGKSWFTVRKEAKGHGQQKLVEGGELGPGVRVLLVDDVVTTGKSIHQALLAIRDTGAQTVFATTLLDRGHRTQELLAAENIRYEAVTTYRDVGIAPVDDRRISA